MDKKDKGKILKWVEIGAFAVLLIGGLNFLLMGLFNLDMYGLVFGEGGVVTRIFYSLFGIAAAILVVTILWKAYMVKAPAKKTAPKAEPKAAEAK